MKRLKIDEFAASMLDDTIEKGQKLEQRDLLKSKKHKDDLRKALSHNPYKPHDMSGESPYYNPYKMDEMGTGWMPHEAESWYEMGKNRERDNYLTVKQFYGHKIDIDHTMNRFAELRRSIDAFEFDIVKGAKAPIGAVHTYSNGMKYRKQGEGQWVPVAEGGVNVADKQAGKKGIDSWDIEDHHEKSSKIQEVIKQKRKDEDLKSDVHKQSMESLRGVLEKMHGGKLPPELEEHFADTNKIHLDPKLVEKVKRKEAGKGHEIHLSKPELTSLLKSGKYALISAGKNPNHKEDSKLDDVTIGQRYEELRDELKKSGHAFTKVTGHYGGEEDSFLVMCHDHESDDKMLELGKKFNQDSVILANGGKQKMIYTTGKNEGQAHEGQGYEEVGDDQPDFFTEYKTSDGQMMKFSLSFDFENLTEHTKGAAKNTAKDKETPKNTNTPKEPTKVNISNRRVKSGVSAEDIANAFK